MTSSEYFRYALKEELYTTLTFFYSVMTIPLQDKNKYFKTVGKKYIVFIGQKEEEIIDKTTDVPLFSLTDSIRLFKEDIPNIKDYVDTTIGRAILNAILLGYNCKDKIPYINEYVDIDTIEGKVADGLKSNKITIEEYVNFVDSCSLLQSLSRIVTISATPKTMTPPPGLVKFKKELKEEFDKNYGVKWVRDAVRVVEFENRLKEFDSEYMKDDPTNGKVTSNKIKNDARSKMYLTFGTDTGFNINNEVPEMVYNSLLEGYPPNIKQLTAIYNSSRAGSFARGDETKDSGTVSKKLLRATSNMVITPGDCGSKLYKTITVTKELSKTLVGRYVKVGNKIEVIEDGSKYIGKTIEIRSPMFCKNKGRQYCAVCCGDNLSQYRKGATIIATDISAVLMKTFLKKMHTATKKIVKSNPLEMIS